MATDEHTGKLTYPQYVDLAEAISPNNLESIALKYFKIPIEKINSLNAEHRGNTEAFKRAVITIWANKNSGPNQVKKLAALLYKAAEEHGYVDPHKVEDVLGVTRTLEQDTQQETEKMPPHTAVIMKAEAAPCMNGCAVEVKKVCTESTSEEIKSAINVQEAFDSEISKNKLEAEDGNLTRGTQLTDGNRPIGKKVMCERDPGMVKTAQGNRGSSKDLTTLNKVSNATRVRVDSELEYFIFQKSCTTKLYIREKGSSNKVCSILKGHRREFKRPVSLQVFLQGHGSSLSTEAIREFGTSLTHLCVDSYYLGNKELKLLSEAVGDRKLSKLSHLCFISCHIRGFDLLFKNGWSSLCHLQLNRCFLSKKKCSTLARVMNQPNRLPLLKSLAIADKNAVEQPIGICSLFKNPSKSIGTLLIDLGEWHYPEVNNLASAIREQRLSNLSLSGIRDISSLGEVLGSLPLKSLSLRRCHVTKHHLKKIAKTIAQLELHELNISQLTSVNLNALFSDKFMTLVTLTLRNCGLISEDLSCLVQANIEGKLPKLKHLDIARNNITGVLQYLLRDNCKWNQLLTLNILDARQDPPIDVSLDCLNSLQKLIVPDNILNILILSKKSWSSLLNLRIFANDENILLCLVDAHEHDFFSALLNVCVKMADENSSVLDTAAARKLVNLSVHDTVIDPTDPDLARCLCNDESFN